MENVDLTNSSGISGVSFSDTQTDGADKLNRAYEFYESQRYNEALSLVENDLSVNNSSYGQVLIGNCYKSLGKNEEALIHWKKAIDISPLEYMAYINIGNDFYSKNEIDKAILNWQIACTIRPENPVVNINLANAYNKKEYRIKATKYFEKYLRYEKNVNSQTYMKVKHVFSNLTAKIDFYAKKVEEFKLQKDLKTIAALYLKMISTYANLPNIYSNIAEIFYFDRNYEKALEFYLLVYLNYSHTPKTLLDVANLYYILQKPTYAYAYYSRAIKLLPEGTSYYNKVKSKISALAYVTKEPEQVEIHLQKAREAEADNNYEVAIDEYENYMILTDSENEDLVQIVNKYKIFVNPEPFVINVLYNQIPDLMNKKKLNSCIDICDRIMALGESHSKEVVYAMKCKAECRRIIIAREQFGV